MRRPAHLFGIALGLGALLVSAASPDSVAQLGAVTQLGAVKKKQKRPPGKHVNGRWYRPSSAFNTPIRAHPALARNNASLIAAFTDPTQFAHGGLGYSLDWVPAVWIADASTPGHPVRIANRNAGYCCVPIPANAVPDPSPEGRMAIMQRKTGTEWNLYKAARNPDGTWRAALVKKTSWTGTGSTSGTVRASGTNEGAGLTRPRDTRKPVGSTWDHALAFSYEGTLAGKYTTPALRSDGTCTDASKCVPMGARFQLDPRIKCRKWPSLVYEWQRQVCRTLQRYGMIVVDTTHSGPTLIEQHRNSLGSYKYPWEGKPGAWGLMPMDLLRHFRVLAGGQARRR